MAQFLIESVLVCLVGGGLGVALPLGFGAALEAVQTTFVLSFSSTSIWAASRTSTAIGIDFGYLPARSAGPLEPVAALAKEEPSSRWCGRNRT